MGKAARKKKVKKGAKGGVSKMDEGVGPARLDHKGRTALTKKLGADIAALRTESLGWSAKTTEGKERKREIAKEVKRLKEKMAALRSGDTAAALAASNLDEAAPLSRARSSSAAPPYAFQMDDDSE